MVVFIQLEQGFIVRLAQAAIDGSLTVEFDENTVSDIMSGFAGPAATVALLSHLSHIRLIRQTQADPPAFEITVDLLRMHEEIVTGTEPNNVVDVESEPRSSFDTDESRDDDIWEPLKIDRGTREYGEAVAAVEEALGVIESDNGYAASEPEERNQIIWSIREGIRTIKENLPSYAQIQSMVEQPLRFISKKFAETAMGEIAKKALGYLFTWLSGL